ncbi:helix-turn-helix domain-containing protein [Streptomyces sp. LaBMicrA B280]|uniref:helix-turn-helix domain-containing protein n=1 Tax=Streptomyces sp. LaBMicrA B280 TaxID=3391001 RepID=UPI003BA6FBB7
MARGLADFNPSELRALRMNVYARPHMSSMTAEELAAAVGATKAQILAYENGHRVPDPPRLRALARALKVHPWQLMNHDAYKSWTLADFRRAYGMRAQDVVDRLGISVKNYRRFENEGIVPSRRPQFLDEVADALGLPSNVIEIAIDRTPAVRRRQARAFELVVAMAEYYVPKAGPWRGPSPEDPNLIELAASYGRPVQRIRRVLTYELGELRQSQVRAQRERVIADYDTDRARQASASHAQSRWNEIYDRDLARIPQRLERFHRSAQPSDLWQLLVDLHNVDATVRSDAGTWTVTRLLCKDHQMLPTRLVEQRHLNDIAICRLSAAGSNHVNLFAGLYAALYPGVRKPRVTSRGGGSARRSGPETFTLPDQPERLVVPQPMLETMRMMITGSKNNFSMPLSPRYDLVVGANTLSIAATDVLFSLDDAD